MSKWVIVGVAESTPDARWSNALFQTQASRRACAICCCLSVSQLEQSHCVICITESTSDIRRAVYCLVPKKSRTVSLVPVRLRFSKVYATRNDGGIRCKLQWEAECHRQAATPYEQDQQLMPPSLMLGQHPNVKCCPHNREVMQQITVGGCRAADFFCVYLKRFFMIFLCAFGGYYCRHSPRVLNV